MLKQVVTVLVVAWALALVACGDDSDGGKKKAAGEACSPTETGAALCASNWCLQDVQCASGQVLPGVCAGEDCSTSGTCSTAGHECLQITGTNQAFCLPTSICN